MKHLTSVLSIVVGIALVAAAVYVVNSHEPMPECNWQPFPPDRYDALSVCKAGPGLFEQLGTIILGIVWPF